jgi:uncharacterized peroxidase-related enzyme
MFLQDPVDTAEATRLYESDLAGQGFVMNLSRLWAWRPDVHVAFASLRSQLTKQSSLSARELGVLVCATAASLGDSYCALAWGTKLAKSSAGSTAAAVLRASQDDGLTAREQALSVWARKVMKNPSATVREDVENLRSAGFSDKEIFEATTFIAFRVAFSTVNGALGAHPDWQVAAAAPPEVRTAVTFGRPSAERTE